MKKLYVQLMALSAAIFLLSCDRERSNPIDPQAAVLVERPDTPNGLQAQGGVERILLAWQAIDAPDLAGYAVFRALHSNGTYAFVTGDGDSTLQITTGKISFIDSLDTPGQTFFYRIAAVDTSGLLSERSNFVGATVVEDLVPPVPPANLSVVADESETGRVVVRWTLPRTDADGGPLTGLSGFVLFRAEGDQGFVPIDTLAADAQSYSDNGLKSLTRYSYRILSFDSKGNKSQLTAPQQTSTLGLPTPSNVVATGDIGRIEIRWSGVDNTDLLGYNVYRSTRSDTGFEALPSKEGADFTTGLTTYVDSGLVGGASFFYKVQSIGRRTLVSEYSVFVGATALADEVAPGAPVDLAAVADENDFGRVVISWNAPLRDADNAQLTGLQVYTVYRSVDTNTSFISVGQVASGDRQIVDTGLDGLTTYFYAVTASDEAGNEGPRSASVQVRTKGPDRDAPSAPQNLSAVADENDFGQVTVSWGASTLDADGGQLTGLTVYTVFRSKGSTNSFQPVATVDASTRQYVDSGLEELTTYYYTVSAADDAGNESVRSQSVQVRTEGPDQVAPSAPQNLSAVADENDFGQVTVSWGASTLDADGGQLTGLTVYTVFRSKGSTNSFQPIATVDASTRQYVDSGLEELTTYYYTVSAADDAGNESVRSQSVQVRTEGPDQVAPSAPQNLSAVADENDFGQVTVSWGASTLDADGGQLTGLTVYTVFRSKGSTNSFQPVATVDASTRQYVDSGLEELTTYYYTVSAADDAGNESVRSQSVQVRTEGPDQVAPSAPQNLSAVADENDFGQVTVSWGASTLDADGGQLTGLTVYTVFRSKGSTNSFQPIATVDASTRQYVDSGLEELTTYYYTVSAADDAGNESVRSQSVQVRTEGPDQVAPSAPQNLSAVADENDFGQVTVSWGASTLDADGGQLTGLTVYTVFRSKGSTNSFQPVATVDASTRQYVDSGLEELTTYYYTVSAADDAGNESVRAQSVQVRTEGPDQVAPSAPQNLSAVADENDFGQVTVSWGASTLDADGGQLTGLTVYTVFRSKGSTNSFQPVATVDASTRQYVDSGLEELTTYYYTVSAADDAGNESVRSQSVQVRTEGPDQVAPSAPQNLSAVADENDFGQVTVSWGASTLDADGGQLTGLTVYTVFRSKGSTNSFQPVATVDASTRQYVDSGLEELTTYYYTVSAADDAGNESVRSQSVQVRTEGPDQVAPSAPQNLSAVADEQVVGQVDLSWGGPTLDAQGGQLSDLSRYIIFRAKESASAFVIVDTLESSVRQYTDSGLDESTVYYYAVSALDAVGNESDRSAMVEVRTEGTDRVPPAAPQNIAAIADEVVFGQIALRWSAPTKDADGGDVTDLASYAVFRSKASTNSFQFVATVDADRREYVDAGLEELTAYYYAVSASDEMGNESVRSGIVQVVTSGPDRVAPAAPQNLSAVADDVSFSQVALVWSAPTRDANGAQLTDLAEYVVFRSKGSRNAFVAIDTVDAQARTYTDRGLEELTTYYYTVSAIDVSGNEGVRAGDVSVLTGGPDQIAPQAPTDLVVLAAPSELQITLGWTPPTRDVNGGNLTGLKAYVVMRSKEDDASFVSIDTVEAGENSYVDSDGLESSTKYYYALRALDEVGNSSGRSSTASAKTAGIEAPFGISATAGIRNITVIWTASIEEDLLGYNVYRSTRSDEGFARLMGIEGTTFSTGQTVYVDSNLVGGQTYFYRVSTITSDGESERSTFVGATVLSDNRAPTAPTLVQAEAVRDDPEKMDLSWNPPTTDVNGAELTGVDRYYVYRADDVAGPYTQVATVTSPAYQDTGLVSVTTYYYQVEAIDQVGNASLPSAVITAITSGVEMPSDVRLSASTPSDVTQSPEVTILWTGSVGAILHYELQRTTVANSNNDSDFVVVGTNSLDTQRVDDTVLRGTTYYYRVRARDIDDRVSEWTVLARVDVKN